MRGNEEGDCELRFRRRRNQNPIATSAINAATATPAPIPAFAPVERPLLLEEVVAAGIEVVGAGVLDDVLIVEGTVTDEKPGMLLMSPCWVKEKLCPV